MWVLAVPVSAAESPITAAQANEMIAELRAIHALLEKSIAPAAANESVSVEVADVPAIGSGTAPVTLVEFADFQCPFCRKFHTAVFEEIKKNYVDTGKVRYLSRDLPLPMHDHATQAANAARCAGEQRRFWEMRHAMIINAQSLETNDLLTYARELNLNMQPFTLCLQQDRYAAAVERDASDAAKIGIVGTPSFVIGLTPKDGPLQGSKIVGAQSYAVFDDKIRMLLSQAGPRTAVAGR